MIYKELHWESNRSGSPVEYDYTTCGLHDAQEPDGLKLQFKRQPSTHLQSLYFNENVVDSGMARKSLELGADTSPPIIESSQVSICLVSSFAIGVRYYGRMVYTKFDIS